MKGTLIIVQKLPNLASTNRSPLTRRGKLYIDALQNRKGQKMAIFYSVRPRLGAMVSTPITWKELSPSLDSTKFTIESVPKRIKKFGDLWADIQSEKNDIKKLIAKLKKIL